MYTETHRDLVHLVLIHIYDTKLTNNAMLIAGLNIELVSGVTAPGIISL